MMSADADDDDDVCVRVFDQIVWNVRICENLSTAGERRYAFATVCVPC